MDPKIIAGAIILGGGGLLYFLSSGEVDTIQDQNKAKWEEYSAEVNTKIDDRTQSLMNELANAPENERAASELFFFHDGTSS